MQSLLASVSMLLLGKRRFKIFFSTGIEKNCIQTLRFWVLKIIDHGSKLEKKTLYWVKQSFLARVAWVVFPPFPLTEMKYGSDVFLLFWYV